jgi:hypothetical protein
MLYHTQKHTQSTTVDSVAAKATHAQHGSWDDVPLDPEIFDSLPFDA